MSAAGYDNLQLRGEYGTEKYWPEKKLKICVTGAGGFIASHLAKRLKEEGHHIVGCDWKRNEHMPVRLPIERAYPESPPPARARDGAAPFASFPPRRRRCALCLFDASRKDKAYPSRSILAPSEPRPSLTPLLRPPPSSPFPQEEMFCDEFILADLRLFENCQKVLKGCDHCFNLAADMGGMGFIQSNHSVIFYNNIMISFNMMEACRVEGITRCFYASSACIYPEGAQLTTELSAGLKESDAWPAQPQDAYGLEKLASEEVYKHYQSDFGIQTRIARFHNIYGPFGTWKGGREKAPAAFCRKAATATTEVEMWGDGKQTRSFTYIDDCVEGIVRLTKSDFAEPVNLGSDEMVSMNQMQEMALKFAGKPDMPIKHIPGPEGVRGRNSNNDLIKEKLGYAPSVKLEDGLKVTFDWISSKIAEEVAGGANAEEAFSKSTICGTMAPTELGALRAADGMEGLAAK